MFRQRIILFIYEGTVPKDLAMATCSRIAMSGIRPIAAPSSEHISGKLNQTVELPSSVLLIENGGSAIDGNPALISPVEQDHY